MQKILIWLGLMGMLVFLASCDDESAENPTTPIIESPAFILFYTNN